MQSRIVTSSLKLCCHGITTIIYIRVFVDVRETSNKEKSFNVAMEIQK